VIKAIDAQIDGEITDVQHRAAYELVQQSLDRAGGTGRDRIPGGALMLRVCQLLHDHKLPARFDMVVMQAVNSQIGPEASRGQRLHACELVQDDVKQFGSKDYASLAGQLMGKDCGPDGKIRMQDLKAVRDGGDRYTAEQRSLASFLLRSDISRNYLDVGDGRGDVDGTISREDLKAARSPGASGLY
jgi:hypothetical protein